MIACALHVYAYHGRLYLPELAVTQAGFYYEYGPVASLPPEPGELRVAIDRLRRTGNLRVATPKRDEYPSVPFVVRAAGARTMLTFEREATLWNIRATETDLRLERLARASRAGWGASEETRIFPATPEGMDALVNAILERTERDQKRR